MQGANSSQGGLLSDRWESPLKHIYFKTEKHIVPVYKPRVFANKEFVYKYVLIGFAKVILYLLQPSVIQTPGIKLSSVNG